MRNSGQMSREVLQRRLQKRVRAWRRFRAVMQVCVCLWVGGWVCACVCACVCVCVCCLFSLCICSVATRKGSIVTKREYTWTDFSPPFFSPRIMATFDLLKHFVRDRFTMFRTIVEASDRRFRIYVALFGLYTPMER